MFDTHPQYTVALVAASARPPPPGHRTRIAGIAGSAEEWRRQAAADGVRVPRGAYGDGLVPPLVRSDREAALLARLRGGDPFPLGPGGRWRCFAVAELHETNDAHLWRAAREGAPLWKGQSFDQYAPDGFGVRACPLSEPVLRRIRKPRPGTGSLVARVDPLPARRAAVRRELGRSRVAFRDVSRGTDSRTVRACLVPAGTMLTNKAPYLAFTAGGAVERLAALGLLNSLPFDWQARRFVEVNLNFFVLESLRVPPLADDDLRAIGLAAARLSCADERFADVGGELGVRPGVPTPGERERLRVEIDARVARAWALSPEDMALMLGDFTAAAVPAAHRAQLLARLAGP
jgi:hypothetical protein